MTELACSLASQQADESLHGTAVESVDTWLLLEVADAWAPKALETEAIPPDVRSRLASWLEVTPRSRLQLIRRPKPRDGTLRLMVVTTDPPRASVVALPDYRAIMTLDLERIRANASSLDVPLCLICVHGRRDRCCAMHGSAVFRALWQREGLELWQTSHLGGHRFAACALWLPEGLMYGRLRPEHADDFVASRARGEIGDLDHFRGRCHYDRPTQAAEIFLRRRLREPATDAISWLSTRSPSESLWEVRFRVDGGDHTVQVGYRATGVTRPASCGKEPEPVGSFVELG